MIHIHGWYGTRWRHVCKAWVGLLLAEFCLQKILEPLDLFLESFKAFQKFGICQLSIW